MKHNWIPCKSFGSLSFGSTISLALKKVARLLEPSYDEADWDVYEIEELKVRISVENGIIYSIECWGEVLYRGHNIVGGSLKDVQKILGMELSVVATDERGEPEQVVSNKDGLILWVEDGGIESVTLSESME